MKQEQVIALLAEVTGEEMGALTPRKVISIEHCSLFGWRALHQGYGCFRIGLAEHERTVAEVCEWYALAEQ